MVENKANQSLLFVCNAFIIYIYISHNTTIVNSLRQKLFSCKHTRTDYSSILQWLVEIVIATVRHEHVCCEIVHLIKDNQIFNTIIL